MKLIDLVAKLQDKAKETPDLNVSTLVFENMTGELVFMNVKAMSPETGKALIGLIKTVSS
jgi:hypothetical protein